MTSETKIAMHPEEDAAESGGPSVQPYFLIKEVLPTDLILHIGNFMKFVDYVRFIRVLWPNNDEDESVRMKLWKMSTHRLRSEFMNGKYLEIEYNYDHTRIEEQRVLINVNTLLPVLGSVIPPDMETFVDVKRLLAFVEATVRLNGCCGHNNASCPCHLNVEPQDAGYFVPPSENGCKDGHFHHFCAQHVNYWLSSVLEFSIKNLEEGSFNEQATSKFVGILANTVYFRHDGQPLLRSSHLYRVI
ncbi:repeat element protein-d10.1 [Ichnoviriform fugitivi]|uniref:Repeat element protein-d10.1 n=1 Tax=Ichnoviriform fugitivi TaxID=265522 RepID=A2Q0M5_9VIRU|nr:repeat element protein-d10.1 [Ichnoviriform fugitivi]BAF45740.1 repeat element protein-d10.1 [Ichnoviriform fugitivi]